ncbi:MULTISPECIES: pantetheine-phosphate adenylyltransferase [unclassified Helicobacter]|uniref:pantetheine-phosphate adenylyltransferase n=1 Tax=unclassified Helicobacter TaxID=2593540 RepID=UPI000CF1A2E1|nr:MULTISPECIES: pantetheine-phosphate adenylyltransferase [unclassified Helicobacter]
MKKLAIYPGTFDPLTNGHIDIIKRSSKIFDEVLVAVASSKTKKPLFDLSDREEMVKLAIKKLANVRCECFDILLADFAQKRNTNIIIRGLRVVSDFEYELQMGYANVSLNNELETIYFMPSLENAFISSSVVRSILEHQGKISHLLPLDVFEYIKNKGYECM